MTTLTKSALAVAVTGMAAGSILDFGGFTVNPSWTVALPIGVVALGFFLISLALESEAAKFDLEQARDMALARVTPAAPALTYEPLLPLPRERFGH